MGTPLRTKFGGAVPLFRPTSWWRDA